MKKTNRQLVLGSLQPFLFCVGMYCVVLIFSVFICTSIYRTMHSKKFSLTMEKKSDNNVMPVATTALVTSFK